MARTISRRAHRRLALLLASTALAALAGTAARAEDKPAELEEVTVTADGAEKPGSRTLVNAAAIERRQPTDIKQLFADNPEIAVAGGSPASQKFYLHGIDQAKLNVQIDGARQGNNVWHHNGTMVIDPMFLKLAGVESGVAAADSGFGSLGGAVRFETKDAADLLLPGRSIGGALNLGYDTNSKSFKATGAGYGKAGGFDFLGMVTREHGGNYTDGNGLEQAGTAANLLSGLAKLSYLSDTGHRFEASVEALRDHELRRLRPNMGYVNAYLNDNLAERLTTTFKYQFLQGTDWYNPEVRAYFNREILERPNTNNLSSPSGQFNANMDGWGATVQNTIKLATGTVTAGIDYLGADRVVDRLVPAAGGLTNDVTERNTVLGAFVQARVSPFERLKLSSGVRVDQQWYTSPSGKDYSNAGISPNTTAELALTDQITAIGAYGYTFGGIENTELALYHARAYADDADLDVTTSRNAKAGLRFRQDGLTLEAMLFHTRIVNPTAYNYSTYVRTNGPDLVSKGVDLLARYDWGHARVSAKYTIADATYGDRMALPSDYNNAVPLGDMVTLEGAYTFEAQALTVGASLEWADDVVGEALTAGGFKPIDGYTVVNAFTEWKALPLNENLVLRAEARNIFDEDYISRGTYPATISGSVTPVFSPGRSFYLSANVKF